MTVKQSAETKLRYAAKRSAALEQMLGRAETERDAYRARATKAEQECAEWKRRFDALLMKASSVETDK